MITALGPRRARSAFTSRPPRRAGKAGDEDALRAGAGDPLRERVVALRLGIEGRGAGDSDPQSAGGPAERVGVDRPSAPPPSLVEHEDPPQPELLGEHGLRHALEVLARDDPEEVPHARRVVRLALLAGPPPVASRPPRVSPGWVRIGLTIASGPPGARFMIGIWT